MKQVPLPKPTEAELAILQVLWNRGASTVREVYEELRVQRETGYTTILKLMQIMARKGLVRRDESRKTHIYEATLGENRTQRQLVRDLLDRAFSGSAEQLVMRAIETKRVSREEMDRIRKLLNTIEGGTS